MKNTNNNSDCKKSNVSGMLFQANLKQDYNQLRTLVRSYWDGKTPIYSVANENIKFVIDLATRAFMRWADINWIDTSKVTSMQGLFSHEDFIGDISKWDVSNVTDVTNMFAYSYFNGDISEWDLSNAKGLYDMFYQRKFHSYAY